jgi:hypothetical protein
VNERGRARLGSTAAAGLVLAALLAIPPSAAASTVVKSQNGVGDGTIVTATATCPKGKRATGGGFATSPPNTLSFIQIYESRKINQNAWRVTGQITDRRDTLLARTLEAHAYCSGSAAPTTTRSKTAATGVGPSFWFTDAQCSGGKKAKAGGFLGEPPYTGGGFVSRSNVVQALLVDKKTHHVTIRSAIPGITFTSFVYCRGAKKIPKKAGTAQTVGQGSQITAFSGECKDKSRRPRAGGFDQPNASLAPEGYYSPIIGSLRIGKQWWVTGVHNGPASTQLRSIAYCS